MAHKNEFSLMKILRKLRIDLSPILLSVLPYGVKKNIFRAAILVFLSFEFLSLSNPVFAAQVFSLNQTVFLTGVDHARDMVMYGGKLYISNNGSVNSLNSAHKNYLLVFDPISNKNVAKIKLPGEPSSVMALGDKVFVITPGLNEIAVIDPQSNKIIKTILVGKNPTQLLGFEHKIYSYNINSHSISVIDSLTLKVVRTYSKLPGTTWMKGISHGEIYVSNNPFAPEFLSPTFAINISTGVIKPPNFVIPRFTHFLATPSYLYFLDDNGTLTIENSITMSMVKTLAQPSWTQGVSGLEVRGDSIFVYYGNNTFDATAQTMTSNWSTTKINPADFSATDLPSLVNTRPSVGDTNNFYVGVGYNDNVYVVFGNSLSEFSNL